MKRVIAFGLFVNAVLLAGILLKKEVVVVHAAGGASVPSGNGDVNGSGKVDLSDAVYLLTYLFQGGPAPVAIECPPPAVKGLPATGQTKCCGLDETQNWIEVPCDQATCKGQDGMYAAGCPSEGRFLDNGDGTVTDNCTGLMWQKDTADVNGGDYTPWCDALAYCESLSFAGHADWRLPNVKELQSIVDYGRDHPTIDPVFGVVSGPYYSSTPSVPGLAWIVFFDYGGTSVSSGGFKVVYVRAVRNAP